MAFQTRSTRCLHYNTLFMIFLTVYITIKVSFKVSFSQTLQIFCLSEIMYGMVMQHGIRKESKFRCKFFLNMSLLASCKQKVVWNKMPVKWNMYVYYVYLKYLIFLCIDALFFVLESCSQVIRFYQVPYSMVQVGWIFFFGAYCVNFNFHMHTGLIWKQIIIALLG